MTAAFFLLASLLCLQPPLSEAVTDHADLCELNHFYDPHAKLIFSQIIFYDFNPAKSRFDVVAWRLVKHRTQQPLYRHDLRLWQSLWLDGAILRRVTSGAYRVTWSQLDPELENRLLLPQDQRRELASPLGKEVNNAARSMGRGNPRLGVRP